MTFWTASKVRAAAHCPLLPGDSCVLPERDYATVEDSIDLQLRERSADDEAEGGEEADVFDQIMCYGTGISSTTQDSSAYVSLSVSHSFPAFCQTTPMRCCSCRSLSR